MGIYLNPGNESFLEMRNSDIYVDKSEMISILNRKIKTKDKYVCVSRPRRFGKSVDAEMLVAYYSKDYNSHELFDALKTYIDLNMDGLKDDVIKMLADESVDVNIKTFQNDMSTFTSKNDILTLLVHLGYLTYNADEKTVRIPNKEVKDEFATVIETSDWGAIL